MRFGLVHRILLDSLVMLGLLALVSTGEFGRIGGATLIAALLAALLLPPRFQERRGMRLFASYAPIALFAVQLARWSSGTNPLVIAVEFAALLQIIRAATRRGAIHDQQLIALALLQLIAATVLGGGLTFAFCFLGFIVVTPPALVLSHLRREVEGNYRQGARDRTGLPVDVPRILRSRRVISRGFVLFISLLSLPVFIVTTVIFISFPRVGLSLLLLEPHRPTRMIGFSDRIDLGGLGTLGSDPTLALRVTYPNLPPDPPRRLALYLRGTTLDHYEGRRWTRTFLERRPLDRHGTQYALTRLPDPVRDPSFTVELEPIDPPVLFIPEQTAALELLSHSNQVLLTPPTLFIGSDLELRYTRLDDRRGPKYRVFLETVAPQAPQLTSAERARYLQLPSAFTRKLSDLAQTWAGNEQSPRTIADRVASHLKKEYRYDLSSPSGKTPNPLEDFLLTSKRGHCEYYSTAMSLLLRSRQIPTRNVTGFAGATYNAYGEFYAVRQSDAHSWVEAWIDGVGWKRYDPTPTVAPTPPSSYQRWALSLRDFVEATSQRWSRHVERYDLRQQLTVLGAVRTSAKATRNWLQFPRVSKRTVIVGLSLCSLGAAIYYWYRRRPRAQKPNTDPLSGSTLEIVRLYQKLERVLVQRGIGRPLATPPLTHVDALVALGHPLSAELRALTVIYLEVRFGGKLLSLEEAKDFSRRVTAIQHTSTTDWQTPEERKASGM